MAWVPASLAAWRSASLSFALELELEVASDCMLADERAVTSSMLIAVLSASNSSSDSEDWLPSSSSATDSCTPVSSPPETELPLKGLEERSAERPEDAD